MRPQGSPEELERRRRRGIELLKAGASVTEVARRLGCSHSSVILWREVVRRRGLKALTAKPAPGRPPKLTAAQQRQLPRLLLRGATAWDFDTDLWTTGRIATVIRRTFGVRLHRAHVGRLLTTLGWSCQKPERRAVERDEAAIARWTRYRWVAVKKLGAPERPSGVPRRMWLPVDSQRPAHLGAPRPHADHPASVSPRQSLGDLGGDCAPGGGAAGSTSISIRGATSPISRSRSSCAPCSASSAGTSSSSGTAAAFTRVPTFAPCSPGVRGCTSSPSRAMRPT